MVNLNKEETIKLFKNIKKNEEEADKIDLSVPVLTPQKVKTNWGKQIENVAILTCILLLIFFSYYFFIAWHNLDLSYNVLRINNAINNAELYDANGSRVTMDFSNILDTGGDYVTRPLTSYYISSLNSISLYFILMAFDCLVLGVLLSKRL
jgi:hypothetical protein